MTFECPEGHRVFAPWKKLRTRRECPICKQNAFIEQDDKILPKNAGVKRTLALDQASKITGYAIFDGDKLVKYGTFTTSSDNEVERFALVRGWLLSMIANWRPDLVGIEGIQLQEESAGHKMGVTVFQTLARLQGVIMITCHEAKIPCTVCPTNTWRHECGVKGRTRADKKRSMQLIVKEQYDISVTDDEADAIGIGTYMVGRYRRNTEITNWET